MPEPAPALSWPTLRRGLLRALVTVGLGLVLMVYTYTHKQVWRHMTLGWALAVLAGDLAGAGRMVALSCVERWLALRPERAGARVWLVVFLLTWASAWLARVWASYLSLIASTGSIPTAMAETVKGLGEYPLLPLVSALWGLSLVALVALRLRGARLRHQIAAVALVAALAGYANLAALGASLSQISLIPFVTQAAILVLGWRAGDWLADRWGAEPIARAEVQAALGAASLDEQERAAGEPPPTA